MTDHELLLALYTFMKNRTFIGGDEASVKDMVQRYKQPPLTMLNRVAMQMTVNDYNLLVAIMQRIQGHLEPVEETTDADIQPA